MKIPRRNFCPLGQRPASFVRVSGKRERGLLLPTAAASPLPTTAASPPPQRIGTTGSPPQRILSPPQAGGHSSPICLHHSRFSSPTHHLLPKPACVLPQSVSSAHIVSFPIMRTCKEAEWGQMSMCDAERRLLANALLDLSNERFVLLSESCIPVHNFTTVYTHLMRSKHSFLGAFDDGGPYGRGRYNENMAPEVNITQWRKGSQWFEVNRKLALAIVEDVMYYPKFQNFCKPHCYVDEHYFPTMLSIKAPQLLANRSITWVDWHRGGPHPATFGRGDISEEFLKGILDGHTCQYNNQSSSICFLFARKFAPNALEPLLELLAPTF